MNIDFSPIEMIISSGSTIGAYFLGKYAHRRAVTATPIDPKIQAQLDAQEAQKLEEALKEQASLILQYVRQQTEQLVALHPYLLNKTQNLDQLVERGCTLVQKVIGNELLSNPPVRSVNSVLELRLPHSRWYDRFALEVKKCTKLVDVYLMAAIFKNGGYDLSSLLRSESKETVNMTLANRFELLRVVKVDVNEVLAIFGVKGSTSHPSPIFYIVKAQNTLRSSMRLQSFNVMGLSYSQVFHEGGSYAYLVTEQASKMITAYMTQFEV